MELEGLLLCSQGPATGPYPKKRIKLCDLNLLRRPDHPSKESYQLSNRFTSKNLSTPQGKKRTIKKERKRTI
jgi:hypothetical protein